MQTDTPIHLSVILPAYNEAARIGATLDAFSAYLAGQDYTYEIFVVNDGSTDNTAEVVTQGINDSAWPNTTLLEYAQNRGKGYAVRHGLSHASGAYRLYSDADGSTPIQEIEKFWPHFEAGAGIVIGSRALPDSDVQVHQAWYRENMGKIYNLLLKCLALTPFPDTQCGFKAFTAKACETILPRQRIERFAFEAELLYIAQRHGIQIEQVPVIWINSPATTVNAITDSAEMILRSIGIRLSALLGRYS